MTREVSPQFMDIGNSIQNSQFLFRLCGRVTTFVDRIGATSLLSSVETWD